MGINVILNKVCANLKNIPVKVFCILLVVLQAFFLDSVIILYYGAPESASSDGMHSYTCKKCYWWIAGDIIVVSMFIVSFAISYRHLEFHRTFKRWNKQHIKAGLPLGSLAWFVYAALLSARVLVIFKTGIDDHLDEKNFYGPNFLKAGICLSAVIFILFTTSHHRPDLPRDEKVFLNSIAGGITFDLLDTVDFLDVLFVNETHILIPYPLENTILAMSVINLLRPTFSFVVLFFKHYTKTKWSRELAAANVLIYIFFLNLPFLVIRMFLWHNLNQDTSVFLIKNFIMIFIGIHELYEVGVEKSEGKSNDIEMYPKTLHPAHRPTDLRDGGDEEVGPPMEEPVEDGQDEPLNGNGNEESRM